MPRLSVFILRTALLQLGIGFTFGALMLANKGIPFEPMLWRLLMPHIELVLIGWTMQLAMGVAFWILPRHRGTKKYGNEALVWGAYISVNVGVIVTALGFWLGADFITFVGRIFEFCAAFLFAIAIFPRVKAFAVQETIS